MKIKRSFHNKDGSTNDIEEETDKTTEELIRYKAVKWGKKSYESYMYKIKNESVSKFDLELSYAEVSNESMAKYEYYAIEYFVADIPPPICQCGSDKLGFPKHSPWCPKHEN